MTDAPRDFDFIVVGSGFGGSVTALRLAEKGYRVAVMEMGCRWTPENLPKTNWSLKRWLWRPGLALYGFFDLKFFKHVVIAHGCAVGGGSITYANTLLVPKDFIWDKGSWAGLAPWKAQMPSHYATALRMLGVAENRIFGPADILLKRLADAQGIGDTYYKTQVAVFQPPEGEEGGKSYPDPYFGGEGPERNTCVACGGCMMGCRYNAKNTLDKNYLYLAEKRGAQVFPETRVVNVVPLNRQADGSEGYEVSTEKSTSWFRKQPRRFTCRGIVFSASALGTMDLLFRLKERGSLPSVSGELGHRVRTNAESLIAVRAPKGHVNLSTGVAIGSGIYIDKHTHAEATRYPEGSDALGFMSTLMTNGRPGWTRILLWLGNMLASMVRHPLKTIRALHPFGWARESLILTCMQSLEGHIDMSLGRPWFWPFRRALVSRGQRIPTYIPQANNFATQAAKMIGGTPLSMVTEILLNIPGTAHVLGGCPMGPSPAEGVVDHRHRVFGYRNMYVCDGSVIAANLGVNPSLTICAMTERAMSYIPPAIKTNWDDSPGKDEGEEFVQATAG